MGSTVMQWLALLSYSKKVLGSNPPTSWSLSVWSLNALPMLVFSVIPKDTHVKLSGDSKLTEGVNVYLSLC